MSRTTSTPPLGFTPGTWQLWCYRARLTRLVTGRLTGWTNPCLAPAMIPDQGTWTAWNGV